MVCFRTLHTYISGAHTHGFAAGKYSEVVAMGPTFCDHYTDYRQLVNQAVNVACFKQVVGGGLGGAPTLPDVCSFLGMGREGESGEEREGGWGWVPGVWSPGVCRLSVDPRVVTLVNGSCSEQRPL